MKSANEMQIDRIRRITGRLSLPNTFAGLLWVGRYGKSWRRWYEGQKSSLYAVSWRPSGQKEREEQSMNKLELKEWLCNAEDHNSIQIVKKEKA
jgi:hypothetical protein